MRRAAPLFEANPHKPLLGNSFPSLTRVARRYGLIACILACSLILIASSHCGSTPQPAAPQPQATADTAVATFNGGGCLVAVDIHAIGNQVMNDWLNSYIRDRTIPMFSLSSIVDAVVAEIRRKIAACPPGSAIKLQLMYHLDPKASIGIRPDALPGAPPSWIPRSWDQKVTAAAVLEELAKDNPNVTKVYLTSCCSTGEEGPINAAFGIPSVQYVVTVGDVIFLQEGKIAGSLYTDRPTFQPAPVTITVWKRDGDGKTTLAPIECDEDEEFDIMNNTCGKKGAAAATVQPVSAPPDAESGATASLPALFKLDFASPGEQVVGAPFRVTARVVKTASERSLPGEDGSEATWRVLRWTLSGQFFGGTNVGPDVVNDAPPLTLASTDSFTAQATFTCSSAGPAWIEYDASLVWYERLIAPVESDNEWDFYGDLEGRVEFECKAVLPSAGQTPVTQEDRPPQVRPISATFIPVAQETIYTIVAEEPDGDPVTIAWSGPDCGEWGQQGTDQTAFRWHHPHPPCDPTTQHASVVVRAVVSDGLWSITCTYRGAHSGTGEECSAPAR